MDSLIDTLIFFPAGFSSCEKQIAIVKKVKKLSNNFSFV